MSRKILTTTMNPEIHIHQVLGDLRVNGWGDPEVAIEADPDDLQSDFQDNILSVSCLGSCAMQIPKAANLVIESVHGDASLKYLDGKVNIQDVFGSLSLRNLGGASLGSLHGDLSAKYLQGDLDARQIIGEAFLRDIQGKCSLDQVSGNFDLRNLGGELKTIVRGNGRLRLSRLSADSYEIQASGNLHCHIPEETNLTLNLSSKEKVIRIKLPHETKTVREEQTTLVLGNGEKRLDLQAGGVLYLYSQSVDWGESEYGFDAALPEDFEGQIAQQVQSQIDAQIEVINRQVNERLAHLTVQASESSLPPDQVQRIIDQARQVSEREAERSQERLRRAQEKLERKLEAAQRRQEYHQRSRREHSWSFNFSTNPHPPAPPVKTVTDEERLMVLKMLEQKKISPEEADRLLSALENE
jgi:SHOCT-like domain